MKKIIPQGTCSDCGHSTYCIREIVERYKEATEQYHDLSIFEEWLLNLSK